MKNLIIVLLLLVTIFGAIANVPDSAQAGGLPDQYILQAGKFELLYDQSTSTLVNLSNLHMIQGFSAPVYNSNLGNGFVAVDSLSCAHGVEYCVTAIDIESLDVMWQVAVDGGKRVEALPGYVLVQTDIYKFTYLNVETGEEIFRTEQVESRPDQADVSTWCMNIKSPGMLQQECDTAPVDVYGGYLPVFVIGDQLYSITIDRGVTELAKVPGLSKNFILFTFESYIWIYDVGQGVNQSTFLDYSGAVLMTLPNASFSFINYNVGSIYVNSGENTGSVLNVVTGKSIQLDKGAACLSGDATTTVDGFPLYINCSGTGYYMFDGGIDYSLSTIGVDFGISWGDGRWLDLTKEFQDLGYALPGEMQIWRNLVVVSFDNGIAAFDLRGNLLWQKIAVVYHLSDSTANHILIQDGQGGWEVLNIHSHATILSSQGF